MVSLDAGKGVERANIALQGGEEVYRDSLICTNAFRKLLVPSIPDKLDFLLAKPTHPLSIHV